MAHRYLIALGSNVRHHRLGPPARVIGAAVAALQGRGLRIEARSAILATAPVGPSRRTYANAAIIAASRLDPPELLDLLKQVEADFGRRPGGLAWRARVLDLDIVLWSGGPWVSDGLVIPHPAFRARDFVLHPATSIAPDWRDPLTGLTLRQLRARLTRPRPIPR